MRDVVRYEPRYTIAHAALDFALAFACGYAVVTVILNANSW